MIFEAFVAAGIYMIASRGGYSAKSAARMFGRAVGKASGSIRRVRAEVERIQARAEALGGTELASGREDLAKKLSTLRNIQAEASSLLTFNQYSYGFSKGGMMSNMGFSDEEIAAALRAEISNPAESNNETQRTSTDGQSILSAMERAPAASSSISSYASGLQHANSSRIPPSFNSQMQTPLIQPSLSFANAYSSVPSDARNIRSSAQLQHPFLPPKLSTATQKTVQYGSMSPNLKPKVKYHTPEGVPVVEAPILKVWEHGSSVHNAPISQPKPQESIIPASQPDSSDHKVDVNDRK